MTNSRRFSKYIMSILLFLLFEAVAITLWLTKGNLFYKQLSFFDLEGIKGNFSYA